MAHKRSQSKRSRKPSRAGGLFENKVAWISSAIILLILFQLFFLRDEGVFSLLKLHREISDMKAHITRLEQEKTELASERDRLLNDPEYLERIARERFRMAKPGEKVFHVVIESKPANRKP